MCSDGFDKDAWIELYVPSLSDENLEAINSITSNPDYCIYSYHTNCVNIKDKGKGNKQVINY